MTVAGCGLITLSVSCSEQVLDELGEFAWFYSDFFVPVGWYQPKLHYTGVYRFLNNPTVTVGVLENYGYALLNQDWGSLAIAILVHGMEYGFQKLVEIPHMN